MPITLRNVKGTALTYQELDDNFLYLSSSYLPLSQTASLSVDSSSYALTASYAPAYLPVAGGTVSGSVQILGTASIAYLNVTIESSSVIYSSGSNQFGDATSDVQVLYGTVIITGSLQVTGSVRAEDITGSLFGTSSWAQNSISSSYASTGLSASYAVSTSYSQTATSSSYALTASYLSGSSATASYALTASEAITARDIYVFCKNDQASTILKGQVVRISGANGDNALIQTASYENDNLSANTLGIATQNIAANDFGEIITTGKLIGIDTSTFSAGDMLYLGANGSIVNVAPVAPLHSVRLGQVLRVQLNNGSMDVRIDNGYEIGELHDVNVSGSQHSDLLVKSGSIWVSSKSLTGSYSILGSLTASLFGTASQAISAGTSSYPIALQGQTIYTPFSTGDFSTGYSVLFGFEAGSGSNGANNSVFIGEQAGKKAANSTYSNFLGQYAGRNSSGSDYSNFMGRFAGSNAENARYSNFLGFSAGNSAANTQYSNFFGNSAGSNAANVLNSNFLGQNAGTYAQSASYSNLFGYRAGNANGLISIGANNTIIGTNITLEGGRQDSINLGGIIFATGAYSDTNTNPYSGSANGRVGINVVNPQYALDVSGSTNISGNLIVSGTISGTISGSIATASYAITASYVEGTAANAISSSYPLAVSGTTIYTPYSNVGSFSANSCIIIGSNAGSGSSAAAQSFFVGINAGLLAVSASNSHFFGFDAGRGGFSASLSNFFGNGAGRLATNASHSNFIGSNAGRGATNSNSSNFIGSQAGNSATNANNSNFFGASTGQSAISASYSNLIGWQVGRRIIGTGIGTNNTIIGTNITLPDGRRDSINLGGVLFASGTYSDLTTNPFSGSVGNGRVGINVVNPQYNLDVLGSANITGNLIVSGTISGVVSGSIETATTASYAITASYVEGTAANAISSSYPLSVSGSTIYTTIGAPLDRSNNFNLTASVLLGFGAGINSIEASNAVFIGTSAGRLTQGLGTVCIGQSTGFLSTSSSYAVIIGQSAGLSSTRNEGSVLIGAGAGSQNTNNGYSVYIGYSSGFNATNATSSIFIGTEAGGYANSAHQSTFIGNYAGRSAINASYSNIIGWQAGRRVGGGSGVGPNNTIIGTNITLPDGRRDSMNLGAIIFATGSYSNLDTNPYSGSVDGKVGINVINPQYALDVSGSMRQEAGYVILTQVSSSLNFTDDTTAAAGGVPLGGLYRNGNAIQIRLA